jgi:hypothetical protein
MADEPNIISAQEQTDNAAAADTTNEPAADVAEPAASAADKETAAPAEAEAGDKTAEGDSPSADAGENKGSPESYSDFTLPEGVEMNSATLEKAAPIFKELGLDQGGAQKLVDFYANVVQEGARSQAEDFSQQVNDWRDAVKNDKELGGDNYDESVKTAQLAVAKLGNPEFSKLLEDHPVVSNHPEMIRMLKKMGEFMKEDVPGASGSATTIQKTPSQILYST